MHAQGFAARLGLIAAAIALTGTVSQAASDTPRDPAGSIISERAARDIAWRSGLIHIEEIALSGRYWQIAGRDGDGNEKALDIDAYEGRVLN
jgi:uncharacterized membrane protein YkoI